MFILCFLIISPLISGYEIGTDKYYHAGGSFLLTEAGAITLPMVLPINKNISRYVIAPGLTLGIGYLKELTDENFSKSDINADLLGIGSALVFNFALQMLFCPRE